MSRICPVPHRFAMSNCELILLKTCSFLALPSLCGVYSFISSSAALSASSAISSPTSGGVCVPFTNPPNYTTSSTSSASNIAMAAATLLSPAALTSLLGDHAPHHLHHRPAPLPPPTSIPSLFSPPAPPVPHPSVVDSITTVSPFLGISDVHHPHPHDIFLHSDFRPSPQPIPGLPGSLPFDARAMDLAAAAAAAVASIRHPANPGAAPAGSLTEPLAFYSQKLKQLAGGSGTNSSSPNPLSPGFPRKPVMTPPSPLSPDDGKRNHFFYNIISLFAKLTRLFFQHIFCAYFLYIFFNIARSYFFQEKVASDVMYATKSFALIPLLSLICAPMTRILLIHAHTADKHSHLTFASAAT